MWSVGEPTGRVFRSGARRRPLRTPKRSIWFGWRTEWTKTRPRRLTNNAARDYAAAWSPDGTKIAFTTDRDGNLEIYAMNADGSGQTRLTTDPAKDYKPAWSPDGTKIAFSSEGVSIRVVVMHADGTGRTPLTNNAFDIGPAWSPDGTKIAFGSSRQGQAYHIYVMKADGSGQVRLTAGVGPSWSPDGTKIAFMDLATPQQI